MQLKLVVNDMWHAGIKGRIWRNMYNINKEAKIYIKTPLGITEQGFPEGILGGWALRKSKKPGWVGTAIPGGWALSN